MDYEKLHKDTINRLQQMVGCGKITVETACGICADFVPESEDERIRKNCIHFLELQKQHHAATFEIEECIDWLEKKGEQSKEATYTHEVVTGNGNIKALVTEKVQLPKFKVGDKIQYLKGCGTIMTIEKIENGEYIFANNMGHTTIEDGNKWYLVEQKPTDWKPQTGDIFRKKGTTHPTYHLCDKREDGITFGFVENREVGISGGEITIFALRQDYELVERPKSIEDVVEEELNKALQTKVEQKPAWSEEDEEHLNSIISDIKADMGAYPRSQEVIDIYNDEISFLKSLKDRYTWKPSDEQMKVLENVRKILHTNDIYSKANHLMYNFEELIRTLNKLRGK